VQNGVSAVLIYFPDKAGERVQGTRRYTKIICHGLGYEKEYIHKMLPPSLFKTIASMYFYDKANSQQILLVPLENIIKIYHPQKSLTRILNGKLRFAQPDTTHKISIAVEQINESIPTKDLGLYGGLQSGMIRRNGIMHDVDFLIYGTKHYSTIVRMSKGNEVDQRLLSPLIYSHPIRKAAAVRKGQLSQYQLRGYSETVCDARIIRRPQDKNTFQKYYTPGERGVEVTLHGATVTDATESLCLFYAYRIIYKDIEYNVIGKHYQFLGAATEGDIVNVKGMKMSNGSIFLLNSEAHYVYVPSN